MEGYAPAINAGLSSGVAEKKCLGPSPPLVLCWCLPQAKPNHQLEGKGAPEGTEQGREGQRLDLGWIGQMGQNHTVPWKSVLYAQSIARAQVGSVGTRYVAV